VRQNGHMADITASPDQPRAVREIADGYVATLADLDPILSTALGLRPGEDRLPDLSPAGQDAADDLARATLAGLTAAESAAGAGLAGDERRCARLLRERLEAGLAMSEQGEHLRAVSNIFGPPNRVRNTFLDMPTASPQDWEAVARRMARVGQALAEYQTSLTAGASRGLFAGPRVVRAAAEHARIEALCGQRIVERYGMTETLMITSVRADGERRAGYVGRPLEAAGE